MLIYTIWWSHMTENNEEDIFEDVEEGKIDDLQLELHKEEKEIKPPIPLSTLLLIFLAILIGASGIAVALGAITNTLATESPSNFVEWVIIYLMLFGGIAIIGGGVSGFWGGQRKIPIRLVSPGDASVVGTGMLVCGYAIEDCIDNEIEFTIYDLKQNILYEEILHIQENGLFYTEIKEEFAPKKKTTTIVIEAWVVSEKTKERKFVVRAAKLKEMNIDSEGIKIGTLHFFPRVHKDFADKAKAIFDPRRKEKGVIENVPISGGGSTNIFHPSKDTSQDKFVPFSFERVAKMRTNALYHDIKRSRRIIISLFFFLMGIGFFIYPIITIFI